ncbi:MAG: hypothetical protein NTY48_02535 [Candidatus Diapherotrites archaeon]|nr:hypothetical protein [Candidatus Diapherotrites archaeon]
MKTNNPKGTQLNTKRNRNKKTIQVSITPSAWLNKVLFGEVLFDFVRFTLDDTKYFESIISINMLASNSKNNRQIERITAVTAILNTPLITRKALSIKLSCNSEIVCTALTEPYIMNPKKTIKSTAKSKMKLSNKLDLNQERESFSASFSLKGENILYSTKQGIAMITSSLINSKIPSSIENISMQEITLK